jgi:hypothetical protein
MHHYTSKFKDSRGAAISYSCETAPEEYRGYQLFTRINGVPGSQVIDIVKDGVCISQYAGPNGARRAVNLMNQVAESTK